MPGFLPPGLPVSSACSGRKGQACVPQKEDFQKCRDELIALRDVREAINKYYERE